MLEYGPQAVKYHEILQSTEFKPSTCKGLLPMMKALPGMQRVMRDNCLTELFALVKSAVGLLGLDMDAQKDELMPDMVGDLVQVMSEACSMWPCDPEMVRLHEEAAALSRCCSQKGLVMGLVKLLEGVVGAQTADLDAFKTAMSTLSSSLSSTTLDKVAVREASGALISQTLLRLMDFLHDYWACSLEFMEDFKLAASLGVQVSSLMEDPEAAEGMNYVSKAVEVLEAWNTVAASKHEFGSSGLLSDVVALQRKLDTMQEPSGQPESFQQHPLVVCFKTMKAEAHEAFVAQSQKMLEAVAESLNVAAQPLVATCKGGKAGESWLAGFKGSTFDHISEHASSTLLKQSPLQQEKSYLHLEEVSYWKIQSPNQLSTSGVLWALAASGRLHVHRVLEKCRGYKNESQESRVRWFLCLTIGLIRFSAL